MNYYLATRKLYKCSECYKQFSVTQGTIFHRSRLPLKIWFKAIYFFTTTKRGVSSVQMAEWLGVRQKTAWFVMQRLREGLKQENEIILSGIVEADESSVGPHIHRDTRLIARRRKHVQEQEEIHGISIRKLRNQPGYTSTIGRPKGLTREERKQRKIAKLNKVKRAPFEIRTYIFGIIETTGNRRIVLKKIGHSKQCISREILYPLLEKHVERKSILITDELSVYDETDKMFVQHLSVNHQVAYKVNGIHTNNIENVWKHFRKVIEGTYFHLSRRHFNRYLDEYTYKWNRRKESKRFLFEDIFPLLIDRQISYRKLIEKPPEKMAAAA